MNGDSCLRTMAKELAEENLKVDMRVVFILHYYVGDLLCNVHICNDVECSFSFPEGYLALITFLVEVLSLLISVLYEFNSVAYRKQGKSCIRNHPANYVS